MPQNGCSAFDVVFLNKLMYAHLTPCSRLVGGTRLRVPAPQRSQDPGAPSAPVWYTCKENDTPRAVAALIGCSLPALVQVPLLFVFSLFVSFF